MRKMNVNGRECLLFGTETARTVLIQPVGNHEAEYLQGEYDHIRELSGRDDFLLVCFPVEDWNRNLSPWKMKAVFGSDDFDGKGNDTLKFIRQDLLNTLEHEHLFIGGYSLAGLFALWAGYETELFEGVVAASPSVWFADWDSYIHENNMQAKSIYLSLGDTEAKTRNPVMRTVRDRILLQYDSLKGKTETVLEFNPGNHFSNPDLRTAKGFAWLLKNQKENC